MKRSVGIRVIAPNGNPKNNVKVSLELQHFMASGFTPSKHTNSDGFAEFELETKQDVRMTVYVGGKPRASNAQLSPCVTVVDGE